MKVTKTAQSFARLVDLMSDRYWYKRYNYQGIVKIESGGHAFKVWQYNPNKVLYFRIPKWLYVGISQHAHNERKSLRESIFASVVQSID